jgi:hypothetical protein
MAVHHIIRSRKKTRVYSLLQPKITADARHNLHKISTSGKVYIHYHSGFFWRNLSLLNSELDECLCGDSWNTHSTECDFTRFRSFVYDSRATHWPWSGTTRWLDVTGHTLRLTRKFNTSAQVYYFLKKDSIAPVCFYTLLICFGPCDWFLWRFVLIWYHQNHRACERFPPITPTWWSCEFSGREANKSIVFNVLTWQFELIYVRNLEYMSKYFCKMCNKIRMMLTQICIKRFLFSFPQRPQLYSLQPIRVMSI